jgi:hypothetical protein
VFSIVHISTGKDLVRPTLSLQFTSNTGAISIDLSVYPGTNISGDNTGWV